MSTLQMGRKNMAPKLHPCQEGPKANMNINMLQIEKPSALVEDSCLEEFSRLV
jgi:hypothetical protein